ncbi:hypothetical protein BGZ63DRAFT_425232 [Mariannaea sp. PMI_226]|nr:hypothetical protein BGZ63DRAFT_425232 [Mariannaea sp. PMI_226]
MTGHLSEEVASDAASLCAELDSEMRTCAAKCKPVEQRDVINTLERRSQYSCAKSAAHPAIKGAANVLYGVLEPLRTTTCQRVPETSAKLVLCFSWLKSSYQFICCFAQELVEEAIGGVPSTLTSTPLRTTEASSRTEMFASKIERSITLTAE